MCQTQKRNLERVNAEGKRFWNVFPGHDLKKVMTVIRMNGELSCDFRSIENYKTSFSKLVFLYK